MEGLADTAAASAAWKPRRACARRMPRILGRGECRQWCIHMPLLQLLIYKRMTAFGAKRTSRFIQQVGQLCLREATPGMSRAVPSGSGWQAMITLYASVHLSPSMVERSPAMNRTFSAALFVLTLSAPALADSLPKGVTLRAYQPVGNGDPNAISCWARRITPPVRGLQCARNSDWARLNARNAAVTAAVMSPVFGVPTGYGMPSGNGNPERTGPRSN